MKNALARKLGERIKELRKRKFLTQEILGERAMVSYKFVGEIERGEANPSIEVLSRIAEALEVPLRDLFVEEGGKKEAPSYKESREHGSYIFESMKRLTPPHDTKKQRQIIKAFRLLKAAFKN